MVEALEETSGQFPAQQLEQFAQKIDRIMGAAQTISQLDPSNKGLQQIGAIAQIASGWDTKPQNTKLLRLFRSSQPSGPTRST